MKIIERYLEPGEMADLTRYAREFNKNVYDSLIFDGSDSSIKTLRKHHEERGERLGFKCAWWTLNVEFCLLGDTEEEIERNLQELICKFQVENLLLFHRGPARFNWFGRYERTLALAGY